MKILIVDHNAVDALSQSVYRWLAEAGDVHVRVIVPAFWHNNYQIVRGGAIKGSDRYAVVALPVWFPRRTHRLVYSGLAGQIREFQPDILYINAEPENFQTLQCAFEKKLSEDSALVFSTWRNIDYTAAGSPYKFPFLHSFAERKVLRCADHGIAFTREALPIFSRLAFTQMTYIPPEIDTTVFTPERGARTRNRGEFTVGFAGRLTKLKGVDSLLEAASQLPPTFKLLIIGGGPESDTLRGQSSSLGLDSRLRWHDPVPRAEMPNLFAQMDVLVLPSRTGVHWKEQFGRVIIEAMACGIPVIGSNSGSIPEVVGSAGLIFPEGNARALRDAILSLRDDERLREQCRQRGLARVASEYALPVVAPKYHLLLGSVAKSRVRSLDV